MRAFSCAVLLLLAAPLSADDWTGFRGPSGTGLSAEKSAPLEWGPEKNVKWKAALPQKANGSPIVSKGRVFTTCSEDPGGRKRSLYCFDRKDGRTLWSRTVEFASTMPKHGANTFCPTTPAADGSRVVVWYGSAGLHCYDYEGKELWKHDLGEFRHMWGYGSSPIFHDGKVILHTGPGKLPFIAAFNAADGKLLWKTEEPNDAVGPDAKGGSTTKDGGKKLIGSWSTPVVAKVGGKDQIICAMPSRIVAYDPADGNVLWFCEGLRHMNAGSECDLAYSSPIIAGDLCVYFGGYSGPGLAIRMTGAKGDVTGTHRVWYTPNWSQSIGSGVYVDGHVYEPDSGGVINCVDPKTGRKLWKERGTNGNVWGSIVTAAGRCYVMNQKGEIVVFKPNPAKLEILARNTMDEPTNSTLAVSDGEIFLQTHEHLYCIAE